MISGSYGEHKQTRRSMARNPRISFMFEIEKSELPAGALLQRYSEMEGAYTDCYSTEVDSMISLPEFVTAFYTTPLFKLERFILKTAVNKPSTDKQVCELVKAKIDKFAAWSVESRADNQLLMCDFAGKTRSWFMIAPLPDRIQIASRLYFGTAVVPARKTKDGKPSIGSTHQALLGFHKLYSRALLSAARSRIRSSRGNHNKT